MILLGFGFSSVWMLAWLAAASVPLVLHLWNRRNHREISWAAMEYLLAAMSKNSRRIRVEQWILLLLRTAIILLVVIAVAGPYLQGMVGSVVAGQPSHKVFVIDGSYSMGYQSSEQTLFERAKQLVTQMIEESRQGDGFSVILMGEPTKVIIGEPSFDPTAVRRELEGLELPHSGGDLATALNHVQQIVEQSATEHPRLVRREVYFLTDLGRTTWHPSPSINGQLKGQAAKLAEDASLAVMDLGQSDLSNSAVTTLNIKQPYATLASDVTIEVSLRNFGARSADHRLQFLVDGQMIKEQVISIGSGDETTTALPYRFQTAGNHTIEAYLLGDALDIDNHRWLSIEVKEHLRVLCVNGNATTGSFRGETDYLMAALQPKKVRPDRQPIQAEVISEGRLSETQLSSYDCIILSNVEQFTDSEAKILAQYAQEGGGLVFFLGDRVLSDQYNRELGPSSSTQLLPTTIEETYAGTAFRFDPLEFKHRIIKPFEGNQKSGLLVPQVFKYWRLDLPKDSSAKVALAFEGSGDPAIVEATTDVSQSIVVAFPASLASVDVTSGEPWTVMPKLPSFVPIVQEMVSSAVSQRMNDKTFVVGEPLTSRTSDDTAPTAIKTPSGRKESLRRGAVGGRGWTFGNTYRSGLYSVLHAVSDPVMHAVNINTHESDLTKVDPVQVPESFRMLQNWVENEEAPAPRVASSQGVHRFFLYAVIGLMLVESTLAWFFGYRAS